MNMRMNLNSLGMEKTEGKKKYLHERTSCMKKIPSECI